MEKIKELLTAKNIFIVMGVFVFIELAWAGFTLLKPAPIKNLSVSTNIDSSSQTVQSLASVDLKSDKVTVKKGEAFKVNIDISSGSTTPGVDIILLFNPDLLAVQPTKTGPVETGKIFESYPQNSLDGKNGKIIISGITDISGGVLANGTLGSITFIARKAGVADIKVDFTKSSTIDSNVTDVHGKDMLSKVSNIQINILP